MSDGDSVGGVLKDFTKETGKQVVNVPKNFIKDAITQIVGTDSEEDETKKKAEKSMTFQRIKEIEAEMAAIRAQNDQKKGPDVKKAETQSAEDDTSKKDKPLDEASRQAVNRAELGRNFKG